MTTVTRPKPRTAVVVAAVLALVAALVTLGPLSCASGDADNGRARVRPSWTAADWT
ncbi:hypothetical protein ABZS86_05645 [Streptomyces sp. NPDC005355]|uniref:hypothetical protein n=1 Tax=unclassified Streptomyces TaxID=2593676 RepID=UPI0033ABF277